MSKTDQGRSRTRRYRVLYAVTRSEQYEIEARNAKEAEDHAFSDGELIDGSGDAVDVVSCGVEEVIRPQRSKDRGAP